MLKGLLLSGLITVAWGAVALWLLRRTQSKSPLNLMVTSFAPAIPAYCLVYALTSPSFGFLPPVLSGTPWHLGFLNGLLFLGLFFLTGVQFYYHFHNSITLRILAEFKRSPGESLTLAQVEAACSVPMLLGARLYALERAHLIRRRGDRFFPTAGGLCIVTVAGPTRAIIKLKP